MMEITWLKALVNSLSSFFHLSANKNLSSEPVQKYYQKIEEILKLLKPVLDGIIDAEIISDEKVQQIFAGLGQAVDELRELFESWRLLMSKVYFVLQVESLMVKVQTSGLEIFEVLKSSVECIPAKLSVVSLELCAQKLKHIGFEQSSATIRQAIKYQVEGSRASSDTLAKIANCLSLNSNQELLIEAVALENLKEKAEQAEKNGEAEYIDQMIALVTHMHDRLVMTKQSQSCSLVPIPADFCCPLSLELMTDPVIVASGQTYERAFIQKWIDLGLSVCPKTRQTLAHNNLIPNYTVKALISNWCEKHIVKLPDALKSISLNQPALLLSQADSPRDSHYQPHSRVNHTVSPDSTRSLDSPRKSSISACEFQQEGSPPSQSHSPSEDSLPGVNANVHALDVEKVYVRSSEDRLVNSGDRSVQLFALPSRDHATGADETSSLGHNRSSSASSTVSNSNFSRGMPGDSNDVSFQAVGYSSDVSGGIVSESQAAASLTTPAREPEFPSRPETRSRSQTIWRRPSSERSVPRIVSSPAVESTVSNSKFSEGMPGDSNDVSSQAVAYSSDVSGGLVSESQPAVSLTMPAREPAFPSRRETRSRCPTIWRRPSSERFVPRIGSCPAVETRANLSGIETQVKALVEDLKSTSLDAQRNATSELRLLAKHNMENRIVISNCGAINLLVNLLRSTDTIIQENAVTALLNLSIHDNNKTAIANADAIEPLIHVLEMGSPEARENSAATLFSLSVIEENKVKIGRSGAIKPLVDLLGNGTPRGKKDAATALFNLSIFHENKARIVQAGAVKYLVELMDPAAGMVDKAVAVLSNLGTIQEGRTAIGQEGGIPVLVEVVELGSARSKENAAAALLQLCTNSSRFYSMVLQEGAIPPLVALSQSGTPRAREKAQTILSYVRSQRQGNAGRG